MRLTITAIALALALSACEPPAEEAGDPAAPEPAATASEPAPAAAGEVAMTMPRAIQGRWRESVGARVTELECDGRDPANAGKVLAVRDEGYTFAETGGRIVSVAERGETMVRASFDTGSSEETFLFEAQDDGQTLIMRQMGENAAAEPVRYLRCPEG